MAEEKVAAPSVADQAAIGKAGAEAIHGAQERGETKQQAKAAAADAVEQTADERGLSFSRADAEMFADVLIQALDARGVFDDPPEPVAAPAPTPAGEVAQAEPAAPAAEAITAVEGSRPSGDAEAAPRHRSFAEKFQSKR